MLGDAGEHALSVERRHDGVRVRLPATAPQAIDPVIVLDIDGRPDVATDTATAVVQPSRAGAPEGVRRRAPSS